MRLSKDEYERNDQPKRLKLWDSSIHGKMDWDCRCGVWHKVPYRYLKRALKAQVGKPWAELHSLWSKKYDRRSFLGYAIWSQIDLMVSEGKRTRDPNIIYHYAWTEFYVDPSNGLLYEEEAKRYKYSPPKDDDEIKQDDLNTLVRIDSIWYHERRKIVLESVRTYGYVDGKYTQTGHRLEERWKLVFRNQLSKAQLKQFGLKNGLKPIVPPSRREVSRRRAA